MALAQGEPQAAFLEVPDDAPGGTGARERREHQLNFVAHFSIGIQHDVAVGVVDEARRQRKPESSALRLAQDAAAQTGPKNMQFGGRHGPFPSRSLSL